MQAGVLKGVLGFFLSLWLWQETANSNQSKRETFILLSSIRLICISLLQDRTLSLSCQMCVCACTCECVLGGPVIGLEMTTSAIYNHEVKAEGAERFTDTQAAGQDGLTFSGEIRTRTLMDDSVTA